jgi:hypothetical protein
MQCSSAGHLGEANIACFSVVHDAPHNRLPELPLVTCGSWEAVAGGDWNAETAGCWKPEAGVCGWKLPLPKRATGLGPPPELSRCNAATSCWGIAAAAAPAGGVLLSPAASRASSACAEVIAASVKP